MLEIRSGEVDLLIGDAGLLVRHVVPHGPMAQLVEHIVAAALAVVPAHHELDEQPGARRVVAAADHVGIGRRVLGGVGRKARDPGDVHARFAHGLLGVVQLGGGAKAQRRPVDGFVDCFHHRVAVGKGGDGHLGEPPEQFHACVVLGELH